MSNQSLIGTNPHLKDAKKYVDALVTNVSTSTAIEIGEISKQISQGILEETQRIISSPHQQKKASLQ